MYDWIVAFLKSPERRGIFFRDFFLADSGKGRVGKQFHVDRGGLSMSVNVDYFNKVNKNKMPPLPRRGHDNDQLPASEAAVAMDVVADPEPPPAAAIFIAPAGAVAPALQDNGVLEVAAAAVVVPEVLPEPAENGEQRNQKKRGFRHIYGDYVTPNEWRNSKQMRVMAATHHIGDIL